MLGRIQEGLGASKTQNLPDLVIMVDGLPIVVLVKGSEEEPSELISFDI